MKAASKKSFSTHGLVFALVLLMGQPAFGADKNNNAAAPKNVPQSSTLSPSSKTPMTKGECEGLGGTVKAVTGCAGTNQTCITVDADGVVRSTCLTVEK